MSRFLCFTMLLLYLSPSKAIECNEPFVCVGRTLSGSTTYSNGYKALYGANSTSSNCNSMHCNGAFSCDAMSSITIDTSTSSPDMYCSGTSACRNTTIDYSQIDFYINCLGANACAFSTITSSTTKESTLQCDADQSCAFTNISNFDVVKAQSAYSLYGAVIERVNTIHLRGAFAGFGARFICNTNNCNIHCDSFDGCDNLYVDCKNCNIFATNVRTPLFVIVDIPQIPSSFDSYSMTIKNDALCSAQWQSYALTLDSYRERYGDSMISTSNQSYVCCRASQSCRSVGNITMQYQGQGNNAIICSGYQSCHGSTLTVNNGSVFCEGYNACNSTHINAANSHVYCIAQQACLFAVVIGMASVICSGYLSCKSAVITSSGFDLDIYFTGYQSGDYATVNCNSGDVCNIYCRGSESCWLLTINCVGDNCIVDCDANDEVSGCPDGNYKTRNPTIATSSPSIYPSLYPTLHPTIATSSPSLYPSLFPTLHPTMIPTSLYPTSYPTLYPTSYPSLYPTSFPLVTLDRTTIHPSEPPSFVGTIYTSPYPTSHSIDTSSGSVTAGSDAVLLFMFIVSGVLLLGVIIWALRRLSKAPTIRLSEVVNTTLTKPEPSYLVSGHAKQMLQAVTLRNVPDADNVLDVSIWLETVLGINLPRYVDAFVNNGYDSLDIIKEIPIENDHELITIGIDSAKHRSAILRAINHLKCDIEGVEMENKTIDNHKTHTHTDTDTSLDLA